MLDGGGLFDFADEPERHRDLVVTVAGLCTQVLGGDLDLSAEMAERLYGPPTLSQLIPFVCPTESDLAQTKRPS
jgi:hypothetical protein